MSIKFIDSIHPVRNTCNALVIIAGERQSTIVVKVHCAVCRNEPSVNGWVEDSLKSKHSSSGVSFFDTLLQSDNTNADESPSKPSPHKRVKTAIVKPNNYQSQSFGDFRAKSDIAEAIKPAEKDVISSEDKAMKQTVHKVRRDGESTDKSSRVTSSKSTENTNSRLRRTKSAENRMPTEQTEDIDYRSQSPISWGSIRTTSASVSSVGSAGSAYVPAIMLKMAPEQDRVYSKVLHIGDRVYIDMSKSRGEWIIGGSYHSTRSGSTC